MQDLEFKTEINLEVLQKEIVIQTKDEFTHWGDVMKLCKNKIKEVEDERKEYTKPIDEAKKRLMDKEKMITQPIKDYISKIETEMGNYYKIEETKRLEEQKRLDEEALKVAEETGQSETIVEVLQDEAKTTRGNIATSTARKEYNFEVLNILEVPRKYMIVNESLIKHDLKKGVEIPGIKPIEIIKFTSR